MRIGMIGQKGLPATYGGIERQVEEVSRRLVARGHEVSVYCRYDYAVATSQLDGIRLIRRPSINTKHLGTATHVLTSTLDTLFRRFDVVHFHALGPSTFSWLPRVRGTSSVVTVHGLDWQREKWGPVASWLLRQCEYSAVHFPSRTVVVSKTLQKYFRDHHGKETVYIPNGANLLPARKPECIGEFGLEPGKYILFVGRLVPEKGVHYLAEAFQGLDTDMKLAIVGGYAFSREYQNRIESYRSERTRLLGYVFGDRLAQLWSNAYLVVLPSTMEGLSIALLEALSYGRCVVMSDIPENAEVAGSCAVTFHSRDVRDLRDKLQMLVDHPEMVRDYEARSREHVRIHFSWDLVTDRLETLYREVAGRH